MRKGGVELVANGDSLRYRRYRLKEVVTARLTDRLKQDKPRVLALLERERRNLKEADRRGLVIGWARDSGWISLRGPTTGEWHEARVSECPPGIVETASATQEGAWAWARRNRYVRARDAPHQARTRRLRLAL